MKNPSRIHENCGAFLTSNIEGKDTCGLYYIFLFLCMWFRCKFVRGIIAELLNSEIVIMIIIVIIAKYLNESLNNHSDNGICFLV